MPDTTLKSHNVRILLADGTVQHGDVLVQSHTMMAVGLFLDAATDGDRLIDATQ